MKLHSKLPGREELRQWWRALSGLARLTLYLLGVEVFLVVVRQLSLAAGSPLGLGLNGWIRFLAWVCGGLLLVLAVRWVRRSLMWRLRNRLIVTYTFIGVIPVLLLLMMGLIAGYLFAGQFATFVATSDLQAELKTLEALNSRLAAEMAARLRDGAPAVRQLRETEEALRHTYGAGVVNAWRGDQPLDKAAARTISRPPAGTEQHRWIARDEGGLWLRAATSVPFRSETLTLVSSVPLDKNLLEGVAAKLGQVTVAAMSPRAHDPAPADSGSKPRLVIGNEEFQLEGRGDNAGTITAGVLPPPSSRYDRGVSFVSTISVLDWDTAAQRTGLLSVQTRPSLLYGRLFRTIGKFADFILVALAAIAIFFAFIELFALFIGLRLTRTMTGSVAALYDATQHINRGELSHRIQVKAQDQLADLERSFNSMAGSLERLIAEQKEKQRLESELAIAQEVQAQLFPKQVSDLKTLEVHGFCRPARTVSGDYYDFLHLGPEKLGLAVGDISGKGISAALLMATIHSAVRVYEMGRIPDQKQLVAAGAAALAAGQNSIATVAPAQGIESPAEVLWLLNRHLYHSTPPEKYATLFLAIYDGQARRLTYSNAGHLPPMLVGHDGSLRRLDTGGTVIGLFDAMSFEERSIELHPDEVFVAYSDGVTEPENEFGEFGEARLIELVREHRHLPLERISEVITAAVIDWIGANEQPDDVTLVLARAR